MHTIQIECTAFEGDNNVYLFDEEPVTLIDTAASTPQIRSQLRESLATYGFSFEDIDRVLLTHFHADHSGLAGEIQEASGAEVYAHAKDAPLIEKENDAWERLEQIQFKRYHEWKIPKQKRAELEGKRLPDRYGLPVDVTRYRSGDTFDVGVGELSVIHTPGHTAGGSSFELDDEQVVFSGDALLPVYTPNVGGADVRVKRPLEQYLETLQYFIRSAPDRVYPGHRHRIDDPAARARYIHRHHEERSMRILRTLDTLGPADAWTIATELFGELNDIHIRHGPGEVYAHVDHLEWKGEIERTGMAYRLAEDTASRLVEFEEEDRWPLEI